MRRRSLGALAGAAVLASTLGLGLATSGPAAAATRSAAPSAFCHTLFSVKNYTPPAGSNYQNYRKWIAAYLPWYEKLAAEAPNASVKRVLSQLVAVLKSEDNLSNEKALAYYIGTHETQWASDWKAFAQAEIACVSQMS